MSTSVSDIMRELEFIEIQHFNINLRNQQELVDKFIKIDIKERKKDNKLNIIKIILMSIPLIYIIIIMVILFKKK